MLETSSSKHILVVEDNEAVADLVQSVLSTYGYRVDVADDLTAIRASREHLPDLILLDVMMPRISGDETARSLNQLPETADIPIVLMSATDDVAQRARRLGAAGYLAKPFDLDDLLRVVEQTLDSASRMGTTDTSRKSP